MANIITLAEYKTLLGVPTSNVQKDAQINALIPAASRAARQFTDRRFDIAIVPVPRTFLLEDEDDNVVEVDDFTGISAISYVVGTSGAPYTMTPDQYIALPYRENSAEDDPHYYIQFVGPFARAGSPQMGFQRNLDKHEWNSVPIYVTVTATWGWSVIPEDVKLAVAWTVQEAIVKPASDDLRAEAIEGYSRTWGATPVTQSLALPNRARDILVNYQRPY